MVWQTSSSCYKRNKQGIGSNEVISHDAPTSYIAAPTNENKAAIHNVLYMLDLKGLKPDAETVSCLSSCLSLSTIENKLAKSSHTFFYTLSKYDNSMQYFEYMGTYGASLISFLTGYNARQCTHHAIITHGLPDYND